MYSPYATTPYATTYTTTTTPTPPMSMADFGSTRLLPPSPPSPSHPSHPSHPPYYSDEGGEDVLGEDGEKDLGTTRMLLAAERRASRELTLQLEEAYAALDRQDADLAGREHESALLRQSLDETRNEFHSLRQSLANVEASADLAKAQNSDLRLRLSKAAAMAGAAGDGDAHIAMLEDVGRQLRSDNERLLALLTATREFGAFADYVNDSDGVTYVGTGPHGHRGPPSIRKERSAWMPEEGWHMALALQRTALPGLDEDTLRSWLHDLNIVWTKREDARVKRITAKLRKENAELRDKMANIRPYDDVLVDEKISSLKRTIRDLRAKLKAKSKRRTENRSGTTLLASSMNTVAALNSRIAELEARNAQLAASLLAQDSGPQDAHSSFLRGVTWLGATLIDKSDILQASISDLLQAYTDATIRMDRSDPSFHTNLVRSQARFADSLDASLIAFRKQLRSVFEHALDHQPDSGDHTTISTLFSHT